MISKGLHKFQSRIGYFSVDLEMVNVIRNNIDKFKGDEVIFSGVTKGAHPKLFSYELSCYFCMHSFYLLPYFSILIKWIYF